jgi:hypothetical protein
MLQIAFSVDAVRAKWEALTKQENEVVARGFKAF